MQSYQTDLEWQGKVYFLDGDVLEDGLFTSDDYEGGFFPVEQPVWGITITGSTGEELEYADDDLVHVATQILNALYWFELSLDDDLKEGEN